MSVNTDELCFKRISLGDYTMSDINQIINVAYYYPGDVDHRQLTKATNPRSPCRYLHACFASVQTSPCSSTESFVRLTMSFLARPLRTKDNICLKSLGKNTGLQINDDCEPMTSLSE